MEEIYTLLLGELERWAFAGIKMLPKLAVAFIVFFLFLKTGYYFRKLSDRILVKVSDNTAVVRMLSGISYLLFITIGLFLALSILDLDKTVTSLLAGAGVIGLAIGFAFQEIASNFISGVFIAFRRPYKLGDIISLEQFTGTITEINMRTTSITTFQGLEVMVPNKDMFTKALINYTSTPIRRVDVAVGVTYDANLRFVKEVTEKALEKLPGRLKEEKIDIFFQEFGDSSINFEARVWINYRGAKDYLEARDEAIILIKEAFDQNNIIIPFPIRTLEWDPKLLSSQ